MSRGRPLAGRPDAPLARYRVIRPLALAPARGKLAATDLHERLARALDAGLAPARWPLLLRGTVLRSLQYSVIFPDDLLERGSWQ